MEQTAAGNVVINVDGSRTEYHEVPTDASTLERLMREIFEQHWDDITAGPIVPGAAYELMYSKAPKVTLSAGYLTVDTGEYHFHLYLGEPEGNAAASTNPELSRQRKISRAVFFSETRAYMALVMGATMAVIMLAYMRGMYKNQRANLGIIGGSLAVFAMALWLVRSQATVDDQSYMRAMIPHHSIAILTSERAHIGDPRVRKLATRSSRASAAKSKR